MSDLELMADTTVRWAWIMGLHHLSFYVLASGLEAQHWPRRGYL